MGDAMQDHALIYRQRKSVTPCTILNAWSRRAPVPLNRSLPAVLCALALVLVSGVRAGAQARLEENEAKAAFVLKLVNFVEWPASAAQRDLVIGIIGADATSEALQRLAAGRTVNGKGLVIRRLAPDGDLKNCHVLYIGASERKNTPSLLERLRGTSVLTVGESDGFGQHGGIVNLLVSEGRIRFEVNPHAAERAHLQISSRLLSLATIVDGG
jgi:hypothetical protein